VWLELPNTETRAQSALPCKERTFFSEKRELPEKDVAPRRSDSGDETSQLRKGKKVMEEKLRDESHARAGTLLKTTSMFASTLSSTASVVRPAALFGRSDSRPRAR